MEKQTRLTNAEQREYAKKLEDYREVRNQYCHGQLIFTNDTYFISYDVDCHNGGFWKRARSIKELQLKKSRDGTFNVNLEKIGK